MIQWLTLFNTYAIINTTSSIREHLDTSTIHRLQEVADPKRTAAAMARIAGAPIKTESLAQADASKVGFEPKLPATDMVSQQERPVPRPRPLAPGVRYVRVPSIQEILAAKSAAAEERRLAEIAALAAEQQAELAAERKAAIEAAYIADHPDEFNNPWEDYREEHGLDDLSYPQLVADEIRSGHAAYQRDRRRTADTRDYDGIVPFDTTDDTSDDEISDPLNGFSVRDPRPSQ